MLNSLRHITSTEPYKSSGGVQIREVTITPWKEPEVTIILEIYPNCNSEFQESETWELHCHDLALSIEIPQAIVPRAEIKIMDDHPLLWRFENEILFTVKSCPADIPSLMGDLFIEH